MPRMSVTLVTTKAQQRTAALARRDVLPVSERRAASQKIAQRRFPVPFGEGTVVAGYSPVRSECDPIPLMRSLAGKGVQLALPVIEKGKTLSFAEWRQGEQLTAGPFGILQPRPGALDVEPDIILVPLVGFDRSGHRIGYGVGYYDRALQALRARRPVIAVGVAFAIQEIDAIVADANDQQLDLILTEREIVDPRSR
jgi:5-formyltetrahydrofolate cyclo-ligase